ncbi:SPOR domain-containing protein [Pseudoduganella umbonata]|uniref:DedD protein n=1 Tax=Pseudoduganella umbonata TaxID=864828 RepID=A0A4P8HNJ2_9BURK|nr:SPOR domain-containing protein [Pseudoduganella umbonata]MBB3224355.1 DedD protein [Pseudoduganella umbonata]QCP11273.1 SPOR domain-containing protein [Pseudoduganella umbonata]
MGLFSKFGKNKQQSPEDSGYYRAADDRAITERARSKRASSADAGAGATRGRGRKDAPDPVLPEKKRARRRLVGAIALALAVAIGLPMVLDSEPKPLANDIAIQIPPRDKPEAAQPAGNKEDSEPHSATDNEQAVDSKTAQAEALDQSEEIVEPEDNTPVVAAPPRPLPDLVKPQPAKVAKVEPKPEPKHEAKPEPKHEPKVAGWDEPKPEPKKLAEARPEPKKPEHKVETKPEPKQEAKPAPKTDDAARALALLEGKAAPAATPADSGRYVIQVAALAARDKVEELQGKLRDAGIRSFTQKSPSGELTRVKVGPFGSREEAEKAKAKLQKIGLSGSLSPA